MESKKSKSADLTSKSGLFFSIGFVASLILVITGFEYRSYDDSGIVSNDAIDETIDEMLEIPPTEQPPPPPPKIQQPKIEEVPDEEEIEEEIEIEFDVEIDEEEIVEDLDFSDEPAEEVAEEVFSIVEDPAMPVGGYQAFYKYIASNMKYPSQARIMGIEGRVFVKFVVDQTGAITEVEVFKGIGGGCDEEAIRVVKGSPNWSIPRQRGMAVKQRIVVPINFRLTK